MTEATPAGAQLSETTSAADVADDAKYAAALAEEGITPDPAQGAKPQGEGDAAAKAPLAPEEIEKRWNDTKTALREERRQARELKQKLADLEKRTAAPAPAAQPAAAAPVQRPDPEEDPLAYLKYVESRIEAGDKVAQEQQQRQEQQTTEQRQVQSIINRMDEYETDFALDTPDYLDAVNHLRSAREQEYQALGYTPDAARAMTAQESFRVTADLMRQGKDPAAAFYQLAQSRGYQPGAMPADPTPAPTPAPTALDRVKAGQKAAQTLSGGGGGTNNNELDAGHVASLKGAAFDKAFDKLRDAARAAERRTGF